MKVTVIETFQDALTGGHYSVGDVIDISDQKRIDNMVDKKLVEVAEPKVSKKVSRKPE